MIPEREKKLKKPIEDYFLDKLAFVVTSHNIAEIVICKTVLDDTVNHSMDIQSSIKNVALMLRQDIVDYCEKWLLRNGLQQVNIWYVLVSPHLTFLYVREIFLNFTNAMSSYTENDLLFVPVDFTFRLISSLRLISREKPDVYKETSGWFHTTMWLQAEKNRPQTLNYFLHIYCQMENIILPHQKIWVD